MPLSSKTASVPRHAKTIATAAMMPRPKRMGRVIDRMVETSSGGLGVVYQSCPVAWLTSPVWVTTDKSMVWYYKEM